MNRPALLFRSDATATHGSIDYDHATDEGLGLYYQ